MVVERDRARPTVRDPPPYVPVDEEYPGRPESTYSLGKLLDETMAPEDYTRFPSFDADARARSWNLWSYIGAATASRWR